MTAEARQSRFPLLNVGEIDRDEGNELLIEWDHPLGPVDRPFGQAAYLLDVGGKPVALAVSASPVSSTIVDQHGETFRRNEMVELARIARHPDHPFVLRPMLRLWREYLGPTWPYNPQRIAISYAMPGTIGDLYRFDGWEKVRRTAKSSGGGTWTKKDPKVAQIGDGTKTLWLWRYA